MFKFFTPTQFYVMAISLSLSFVTGCGTTAKFVYPGKMNSLVELDSAPIHPQKVAVIPFDDCRNDDNQMGTIFLQYVPLMPFGYVDYDRPDAARWFVSIDRFEFSPSEDLAKAAAVSLRRSNLFEDAFFTFGGEKANADLVLEGKIISTHYYGRLFSYGLDFAGVYLWILGAPCGTSSNRLALHLTLKNKAKKIIWEYSFDRDDYLTQWLYCRLGHDAKSYSVLMEQAMNEAIRDLDSKLKNNPQLLK